MFWGINMSSCKEGQRKMRGKTFLPGRKKQPSPTLRFTISMSCIIVSVISQVEVETSAGDVVINVRD